MKEEASEDQLRMNRLHTLETIVAHSPVVVFLWRFAPGEWPVELVTDNVRTLMGYTANDFITGRVNWPGVTDPDDVPRLELEVSSLLKNGAEEWVQEYRVITKSGLRRWIRDWNRPIRDASGAITHIQGMLSDITDQKEAENALARTHRALLFLAEVNRVLNRAETEQELLSQVSEVSMTVGGYRMAWVGQIGNRRRPFIRSPASVEPNRRLPGGECACPAIQEVLRTGRPCICQNIQKKTPCSTCRWKIRKHGAVSAISLPLKVNSENLGTLCLRSGRHDPFDLEEVDLLMRLASDLAFGMQVLRNREERAALERELLEISEREQRRIGQDLHDTLGQSIAGIQYLLSATQQKMASGQEGVFEDLKYIAKLACQMGKQAHDLSRSLVPPELRSGKLIDALQGLAENTRSVYSINCRVTTRLKEIRMPDLTVAGQIFRIAQEAVNNAARHSGTREIRIHVSRPDGRLTVAVRDYGTGASRRNDADRQGLGLRIMRYRSDMIGASLHIQKEPGKGSTITCRLPGKSRTARCRKI